MSRIFSRQSGVWQRAAPQARLNNSWARAKEGYARVSGVWRQWWLDGGVNDRTFTEYDVYSGFNGQVNAVAVQSDGKILVGGTFVTWNTTSVGRLVRLNSDFTLDTAFNANIGTGATPDIVQSIVVQSDGRILVAGNFTSWNGATVGRIVRLNSDGTRDTTFGTGLGASATINAIAVQSDGRIVVGGSFTSWDGVTVGCIARLNPSGSLDTGFNTNTGSAANGTIFALAVQSDGRILAGGMFTAWSTNSAGNRIVRLNSDGTRDLGFNTNTGTSANNIINALALQSNGQIVVGGNFTAWNGATTSRIARLNSDGTRDTTFTTNVSTAANNTINALAVQPNGQILVGGVFGTWIGVTVNRIVRLNSDGTRDTTFTTNTGAAANSTVSTFAIQANGQILVGGLFGTWNLAPINRLVRLNSDGNRDFTNTGTAANNIINAIVVQSDGRILVGGEFTAWNGATVGRIVRLNSDGTRDTVFATNTGTAANNTVNTIAVQSNGQILVGGQFASWNGVAVNRVVRLNSDGTLDTAFIANIGTGAGGTVSTIAVQPNGQILVGGQFATWNGAAVNRIVRLNSDGTRDTVFTTNTGTAANNTVRAFNVQSNGQILVGGSFGTWNGVTVGFIVRLNSDGTRDTAFTTNTGTAANNIVNAIAVQSDGQILVGGLFTTWNGATVGRIVRLSPDGTRDTVFTTNTGLAANGAINAIAVQSDERILAGGAFTTWSGAAVSRIMARLNASGTRDTVFTTNTGTAASGTVSTIAVQPDGRILVGGDFTAWNAIVRNNIARIGGE